MRNQREMSMRCARAKRYTIHGIDVLIEWEKFSQVTGDHCQLHCGIETNEQDRPKKKHQQKNRA